MQVFGVQDWDFGGQMGVEMEKSPGSKSLGRDVLRGVSRSFYLSLRCLPSGFREPASLGYLLARLSDTIADAGSLAVAARVDLLARFRELAGALPAVDGVEGFVQDLRSGMARAGLPAGEQILVARAEEVFAAASQLGETHRAAVRTVIAIIVDGQGWDLTRFAGDGCVVLAEDEELEHYAYQVAGCVGEFWTVLAHDLNSRPATASRRQMDEWGRNYGMGLQLVNILRDLPEDLQRGRCYLPGVNPENRTALLEAAGRWRNHARAWLQDGFRYVDALRGFRLKLASGLPALLGMRTLDLLDAASWEDLARGVKVTREDVKQAMARAAALSAPILPGRW